MTTYKKLENLDVKFIDLSDDQIKITTECGKEFLFYHDQSCCENVYIYDNIGDLKVLEGQKLLYVDVDASGDIPSDVTYRPTDCYTWTNITFRTNKDTVISRWIGESNGYYSEAVDFTELGHI